MKTLGKKNKNYVQGIFHPKNPNKYKGTLPVIYRSSLELLSFRYLDNSQNVITWGSESVVVPYQSPKDGRLHRYFVDLVAEIKMKDSSTRKVLIEVKPEKQTKKPIYEGVNTLSKLKSYNRNMQIWITNQAKFKAAKEWALKRGFKFGVIDENFLFKSK